MVHTVTYGYYYKLPFRRHSFNKMKAINLFVVFNAKHVIEFYLIKYEKHIANVQQLNNNTHLHIIQQNGKGNRKSRRKKEHNNERK